MSRGRVRVAAAAASLAVVMLGIIGAYSYGHDFDLRRGFSSVSQLPRAGTGRLPPIRFFSHVLHERPLRAGNLHQLV